MASLQAQLQAPQSSLPKLTTFNAIVELVKDTLPTEVLITTDSPQKRGRGDSASLFEPQAEQVAHLPWHEDTVRAFEACANEIAHPSSQMKKGQPPLWMGSYLKAGKMSQTCAAYFKPEVMSSTLYPAQVNANLADLSDGPLKDKKSISMGKRIQRSQSL